ncbi:(+)-neomenthol dehydrogenase 1 [Seiridium cupressi]
MAASNKDIVFITGENTGLGVEIARKLLREHAHRFHVIIGSRTLAKGNAAVDGLKAEGFDGVETVQVDVTSEESLATAAKTVTERHGRVNVLHVNAGIALDLNYTDRKDWPLSRLLMTSVETNVAGAAATVETFVLLLEKAENPRVVFMTSGAGSVQLAHDHVVLSLNWPSYSVSKAALNMLMMHYFHKFPQWKVNACALGFRATNLNNFGKGSPGGVPPGPVEDGAVNAVRLSLLRKGGERGAFTQLVGKDGHGEIPW